MLYCMSILTPSQTGERSEAALLNALTQCGYSVYLPFGSSSRCDMVIERGQDLWRVQCKNGVFRNGCIRFATCSNTGNVPLDYRGQADMFGVYCHELHGCYLVPVEHVPTRFAILRVRPARNGQSIGVRWAETYLLRPGAAVVCPQSRPQRQLELATATSASGPPP